MPSNWSADPSAPPIIRSHWIMLPVFSGLSHRTRHCIFAPYRSALAGDADQPQEDAMSVLSYAADLHTKTSLRPSRRAIKRAALVLVLALGAAGAADFGYGYLTTGRYLESTDDAYVKADSTIVSPKVSGYIAEVLVGDNQPVKAGQLLAHIDDRDFRTALDQARADVAASEAAVRNLDAQISLQQPLIEQGTADVAADEDRLRHHPARAADRRGAARKGRAVTAWQIRTARGRAKDRRSHLGSRQGCGATGSRPRGRSAGRA